MENNYKKNLSTKLRTRHIDHLWMIIVMLVCVVQSSVCHIDFDDVETSWLENVAVQVLPNSNMKSMPLLKLTGLASTDIEDGVQIKPTFSATDCIGNETELQIVNTVEPLQNRINTDLFFSLMNFNFKQYSAAYLCIKPKDDHNFQHMGLNSKFSE